MRGQCSSSTHINFKVHIILTAMSSWSRGKASSASSCTEESALTVTDPLLTVNIYTHTHTQCKYPHGICSHLNYICTIILNAVWKSPIASLILTIFSRPVLITSPDSQIFNPIIQLAGLSIIVTFSSGVMSAKCTPTLIVFCLDVIKHFVVVFGINNSQKGKKESRSLPPPQKKRKWTWLTVVRHKLLSLYAGRRLQTAS